MKRFLLLFLAAGMLLGSSACQRQKDETGLLQIVFLDVGQGDCILIRIGNDNILVDAGTDASEEFLCARLSQLGVRRLSLAVFTHSDSDHIGGADGVLSMIPADLILYNEEGSDDAANRFQSVIAEGSFSCSKALAGDGISFGALDLLVLSPFLPDQKEGNDNSIVLRLSYETVSALFMGDLESSGEEKLISVYPQKLLDCDLIKIGHHGSNTSTNESFLKIATPKYALISCGADNSYGHPHGIVLKRLSDCNAGVLRTDLLGEIRFLTDGITWDVNTGKEKAGFDG